MVSDQSEKVVVEALSPQNLSEVTNMLLEFWTDSNYAEEYSNFERILTSSKEKCFLLRNNQQYLGFIYLSLRTDYVEGASSSKVVYVEGIYIRPEFRKQGFGRLLIELGEDWGKQEGSIEYASDVELYNEASQKFHEKMGFKEINRTVHYLKDIK